MKRLYWGAAYLFFRQVCLHSAYSEDFGHIAPVYPIFEEDASVYFRQKMMKEQEAGHVEEEVNVQKKKMQNYFMHPRGVSLPELTSPKTHIVNMTFVLENDAVDDHGEMIAHRGERINPLQYISYAHVLCFLDGRSKRQIFWGKKYCPEEPVGHVIFVHEPWRVYGNKKRVYFDQYGILAHRFSIDGLPALVRQKGLYMEVLEGF